MASGNVLRELPEKERKDGGKEEGKGGMGMMGGRKLMGETCWEARGSRVGKKKGGNRGSAFKVRDEDRGSTEESDM